MPAAYKCCGAAGGGYSGAEREDRDMFPPRSLISALLLLPGGNN